MRALQSHHTSGGGMRSHSIRSYIKCCANRGKGELRGLYKDFGDVRHDTSNRVAFDNVVLLRAFITWWRAPIAGKGYTKSPD